MGAPIFYRDVPLIASPTEKGVIQPLPASAIHLIKWRIRNIAEPQSKVVMDNLPTCANCHSFSLDGRTLGLDVDGPQNDKGLYALVPVTRNMTIRNRDVIRWSSFQDRAAGKSSAPAVKRFGFMSQVSPDGRYVVTTIEDPKTQATHPAGGFVRGLADRFFNAGYPDYRFGQVFYPTRGILAYYSQETGGKTAASARRRRPTLRAGGSLLVAGREVPDFQPCGSARSLSARPSGADFRQRSEGNADPVRSLPNSLQRWQGRSGRAYRRRFAKRQEQ